MTPVFFETTKKKEHQKELRLHHVSMDRTQTSLSPTGNKFLTTLVDHMLHRGPGGCGCPAHEGRVTRAPWPHEKPVRRSGREGTERHTARTRSLTSPSCHFSLLRISLPPHLLRKMLNDSTQKGGVNNQKICFCLMSSF